MLGSLRPALVCEQSSSLLVESKGGLPEFGCTFPTRSSPENSISWRANCRLFSHMNGARAGRQVRGENNQRRQLDLKVDRKQIQLPRLTSGVDSRSSGLCMQNRRLQVEYGGKGWSTEIYLIIREQKRSN